MVRGGARRVADALVAELEAAGGELVTGHRVGSIGELPAARAVLLDVTPRQLRGHRRRPAVARTRRRAERFRYGSGVFKVDWALDGPVPWTADGLRRAATVHLGGTLEEIAAGSRRSRPADTRIGRSSCSSSTRRGIPRARPRARPRPGPTATSRRARTST